MSQAVRPTKDAQSDSGNSVKEILGARPLVLNCKRKMNKI